MNSRFIRKCYVYGCSGFANDGAIQFKGIFGGRRDPSGGVVVTDPDNSPPMSLDGFSISNGMKFR